MNNSVKPVERFKKLVRFKGKGGMELLTLQINKKR